MSQHFFYMIKKYQERMSSKYQRKGAAEKKQEEQKPSEAELKKIYESIEEKKEQAEKERLAGLGESVFQVNAQQQLRNIDPFERKRRLA